MATATEQRILVTLTLPTPVAALLDEESKTSGVSLAPLIRRVVKWHRGLAIGRHPDSPPVKLSNRVSKSKVSKGVLLDEDDVEYLDRMAGRVGVPRVSALLMVLFQWFEIDPFPRTTPK